MSQDEIRAKYKAIHDRLTEDYYVLKVIDKATFEAQHAKCWQDMDNELKPFMPKQYRVYSKKITTPKRTIYQNLSMETDLSSDEIAALQSQGLIVEEIV